MQAIGEALDSGAPLVTVCGPAGAGKTSTALEILRHARERPAVGVLFCELADQRSDAGFVAAVARSFGLGVARSEAELRDVVAARLASEGPLLAVLDNFEQLPEEAATTLDAWIAAAQEAQFLVTSRAPLRLPGEVCVELPPLALGDAVALFEDRARAAGAAVDPAARPLVEQLVLRLDGVPLAIELAAGRADVMTPAGMLDQLRSRFDLLERDGLGGHDRHASLRGAIAWSWELVREAERQVLARLSAFQGPFTVQAARVVADSILPIDEVLHALRRRSLLAGGAGEGGRFRLLESVRDFAAQELSHGGDAAPTWMRHALWAAEQAEQAAARRRAASDSSGGGIEDVLADALAAHGRCPDPRIRVRIVEALHRFLAERGPTPVHSSLLNACVADTIGLADEPRQVDAHLMRAELRILCADVGAAEEDVAASLAILARCPDPAREAMALDICSQCQLFRRAPAGALSSAESAIALERTPGVDAGASRYRRAIALALLGRAKEARHAGEESVVHYAQRRQLGLEAEARLALAKIAHHTADRTAALLQYRAAARLHRKLGDRRGLGSVALNLGSVLDDAARFGLARRVLGAAAAIATELGDRGQRAAAVLRLGLLDLQSGSAQEAEARFVEVLSTRDQAEDGARASLAFLGLGVAAALRGDLSAAAGHLKRAAETPGVAPSERLIAHAYAAVVGALAADAPTASEQLARARADLPPGDELRALLVELAAAATDGDVERRSARLASVRERMRASLPSPVPAELRIADLLVSLFTGRFRPGSASAATPPDLQVELDGRWFVRGADTVQLGRRRAARFVLAALVEARLQRPGAGVSADEVLAEGWPGERVLHDAGQLRVRNVVRELRALGLRDFLLTRDDGYLIDPAVAVERMPRGAPAPGARNSHLLSRAPSPHRG
jgi:predicted ATPase